MPSTCKTLDNCGSKRLSGVWLESWLLFGIQVLWKNVYLRKTVRQRAAALFGPWGYKPRKSFSVENTSKGCKIQFFLLSEAGSCPHGGGQCIILFAQAWMKEETLSWGFALIWISLREEESGTLSSPSFPPSFISYSPHTSHPSLSGAPRATCCSVRRGPGFSGCREHVADRLCSPLLLTTVHSPASASILNASKTSGTVQQTKPQPQLTEWTAGLQPERRFDPLCIMFLRVCT